MSDWLKNLKAGDAVVLEWAPYFGHPGAQAYRQVKQVTKTSVVLESGERFCRKTGDIRPKPERGYCRILDAVLVETRDLLKRIQRAQPLTPEANDVPLDKLRRIVAILEDREWVNGVPASGGLYWLWWSGIGIPLEVVVTQAVFSGCCDRNKFSAGDLICGKLIGGDIRDWVNVADMKDPSYWYCPMVAPSPPKIEPTQTE